MGGLLFQVKGRWMVGPAIPRIILRTLTLTITSRKQQSRGRNTTQQTVKVHTQGSMTVNPLVEAKENGKRNIRSKKCLLNANQSVRKIKHVLLSIFETTVSTKITHLVEVPVNGGLPLRTHRTLSAIVKIVGSRAKLTSARHQILLIVHQVCLVLRRQRIPPRSRRLHRP